MTRQSERTEGLPISPSGETPLTMTDEFRTALALLEKGTGNLFITGRAGTGKSTLLQYFRSTTSKNIAVLAPTGVAAINVRGQTIHSFFGFKPNITMEGVKKKRGESLKLYKKLEAVVIDEISMVRADLFDALARFLELNGRKPGLPFGGVQIILFGYLYQLPPVVRRAEEDLFRHHYESPYFFSAKSFSSLSIQWIELTRVFRQTDSDFLDLLNRIRKQTITDSELARINTQMIDTREGSHREGMITLTTTKRQAEEVNLSQLERLRGKKEIFQASVEGNFDESSYPTEAELTLKEGAQIMLLNNDSLGRWVNGTIARIKKIDAKEERLTVIMPDHCEEEVVPYKWDLFHFTVDSKSGRVVPVSVGTFTQMPVRLAWAITIHKSQGLTFDRAVIDLTHRTFAHGQLYVAISRLRTLDGLFLTHPIKKTDIFLDRRIQKFITTHQYVQSENALPLEQKMAFLQQAIREGFAIQMVYLKSSDEKTTRTILPIRVGEMVFADKTFPGLTAYCNSRKEERTFNVTRILEMKQVDRPF